MGESDSLVSDASMVTEITDSGPAWTHTSPVSLLSEDLSEAQVDKQTKNSNCDSDVPPL